MDGGAAGRETMDYLAITRLQSAYADVVTRRAWPELVDLFVSDAEIRVDTVTNPPIILAGPVELGEFIGKAIARFSFFEFVILNSRVEVGASAGADAARARVFISEIRQDAETAAWSNTYGVYHDTYERADDRWRFARRAYQSLARTGSDVAFPFPTGFEVG